MANHSELVTTLSETTDLQKTVVDTFLRELYAAIQEELEAGNEVTLLGLGKLKVKTRAARKARNPSTGAVIEVPAKKTVTFAPTTALKEQVQ